MDQRRAGGTPPGASSTGEGWGAEPRGHRTFDLAFRKRIRGRDRAAWDELAEKYHAVLCRQAARILPPHMDSENAVGDMWVRALRASKQYDVTRQPYPWLARICVTTCLDQRRKIKRRSSWLDKFHILQAQQRGASESDCEPRSLTWALQQLPPREREVITLRYLFYLSSREIGDLLGIQDEALRKATRRGLARMRSVLAQSDQPGTSREASTS